MEKIGEQTLCLKYLTLLIKYYLSKKVDKLKSKPLKDLNKDDIALLTNPLMKKLKADLKPKFAKEIVGQKSSGTLEIEFRDVQRGGGDPAAAYIML